MHDNRTSLQQDWYIPLPLPLSVARKGGRADGQEAVTVKIRVGRPSLHWILFFIGSANLARTAVAEGHVEDTVVTWVYVGCILAAALTAKLVSKLATRERTPRSLTALLGMTGFGYSTISMSTGDQAVLALSAAGSVLLLTLIGEAGYRISQRRRSTSEGTDQQEPAPHGANRVASPGRPKTSQPSSLVEISSTARTAGRSSGRARRRRRRSGSGNNLPKAA